jgi:hypothetical protein
MPTAGIDFDQLTEEQRSALNSLPAMLYHGVSTEGGVLMRMNSAPRSVADPLGRRFQDELAGAGEERTARHARRFLNDLDDNDWQAVAPEDSSLSGADYKQVWELLTGKR